MANSSVTLKVKDDCYRLSGSQALLARNLAATTSKYEDWESQFVAVFAAVKTESVVPTPAKDFYTAERKAAKAREAASKAK